jgi:dipeptidyl aminopeptidase/acylaminoacyl peptidase
VAFTRNDAGFGELCVADAASGTVTQVDRGVFAGLSWVGDVLVALRSGARTPDQIVAYSGVAGAGSAAAARRTPARLTLARGPVAGFEASGLVEPEIVEWPVADVPGAGATAHGRLFRAAGAGAGAGEQGDTPAPLVVWVHGGPTGQHQVMFNPRTAFLVARGWNVLQVDPRGSTGWGRAYAQAINGRWGRIDVADTVAAIEAACDRGWGDPGRVALMGASSAGLTVLSVMVHHPGLCAAGIDLYGVTDLFALHETTHRFEAHYNPILLGPLPAAAPEWRNRSPITHAGRIRDPLLVLHGDADEVVPVAQSERLVAAASAAGAPVEFHVYAGEGHGWSRPETTADELTRIDAFLTRYVLRGPRT